MRRSTRGIFILLATLAATVCAQDESGPVFDQARLHQVRLTMSPADWQAVRQWALEPEGTPPPEVVATFQWGGDPPVTGCRVKPDGYGSRSFFKPRLNVKFPTGTR